MAVPVPGTDSVVVSKYFIIRGAARQELFRGLPDGVELIAARRFNLFNLRGRRGAGVARVDFALFVWGGCGCKGAAALQPALPMKLIY